MVHPETTMPRPHPRGGHTTRQAAHTSTLHSRALRSRGCLSHLLRRANAHDLWRLDSSVDTLEQLIRRQDGPERTGKRGRSQAEAPVLVMALYPVRPQQVANVQNNFPMGYWSQQSRALFRSSHRTRKPFCLHETRHRRQTWSERVLSSLRLQTYNQKRMTRSLPRKALWHHRLRSRCDKLSGQRR